MHLNTKKTEYARTNNASQLAAMKYLNQKKPSRYKLVVQKFTTFGNDLEYKLLERFFDHNKKEEWKQIGTVGYKINFIDWN